MARTPDRTIPRPTTSSRRSTSWSRRRRTACGSKPSGDPPMPDYLAEAVHHSYARYTPEETE